MAAMTEAMAGGHLADVTGVAGQPPEWPRPMAMTGIVQPRGHSGWELRCLACGAVFVAKRRDARTCSRRCAARLWPSRTTTGPPTDGRRCADTDCDTVLTGRSDQRFCSDRCRQRAQRRRSGRVTAPVPLPSTEHSGHSTGRAAP
jgi:predicted nucleic acid-binding Zn ribbon protein